MKKHIIALTVGSLLTLGQTDVLAATGEVTLSGSTWTGRVDGSTVYTGFSMAGAASACAANMSSGTINIRNSGNKNGQIRIFSNITVDGTGRTISGGGTAGIVYAQNSSNVGGRNIVMASDDWYGMYFRTCNGVNVSGTGGTANLGFRVDDCRGGPGYNLTLGSPSSSTSGSTGSHFAETYGISGVNWGTVTASDRTDGCALLLNASSSCSGSAVNGTRCDWGGGYAGFRVANNNGATTLGTVNSTSCGRGIFSVSGSRDLTISTGNSTVSTSHGIWFQTTYNSRVNSGTVSGGNPCTAISGGSGNVINVNCGGGGGGTTYYKFRNVATSLYVDGMGRTANGDNCGQWGSSSSYNQQWSIETTGSYVKLRNRGTGLYLDGMGRTANGDNCGQWSSSSSYNQQWTQSTVSGNYKYQNRSSGLFVDGMGRTSNGSDLGQWSSGSSNNQRWARTQI